MGGKGPLPKSVAQRAAEGDQGRRGKTMLAAQAASEVKAPTGLSEKPPSTLVGKHARRSWVTWVQCLEVMKLDRTPDANALEGACAAYQLAVDSDAKIHKEGFVLYTKDGPMKHPAVDIRFKAWDEVRRFCIEFGFTPASRLRMMSSNLGGAGFNKPGDGDGDEDLMKKLGAGRTPKVSPPTTDGEGETGSSKRVH